MPTGTVDPTRTRLLAAAKTLFARQGYENTATSAIARDASTSESQLVRYFGGKAGLLDAIFDESWAPLNARVHDLLADAVDARHAVGAILTAVLSAFERDEELAIIFLFEGRRIHAGTNQVRLSAGFEEFNGVIQRLIRRGQKDGSFSQEFDADAMTAAFMGAVEGMVRERLLAKRDDAPRPFSDRQVQRIFQAILDGFTPQRPLKQESRRRSSGR
jgi:AcrR family transcriptional regulator